MSIPHISTGRKSVIPSQRTSKQAYQTRPVPEKREQDQQYSQDTKPLNPHNPTHPFEGQTGSPSVPRSAPPRNKPPHTQGPPQTSFKWSSLCYLTLGRQVRSIPPS